MLGENRDTQKIIKVIAICFGILVLGIIIYVLVINLSRVGKVAVEIKYAPFEATVFIDGQNYPVNNAINYVDPGHHHIMVVMEGFKTLEEDVEVTTETKYLYGVLKALDESNVELYRQYQSDYIDVERIEGRKATENARKLVEEWPILGYLPYIKDNYAIGSQFSEQNELIITIRAEAAQLDNAVNRLRSFNIPVSNYEIKIKDFKNELEDKFNNNRNPDPVGYLMDGYQGLPISYQVNEGRRINDYYCTTISVGKYAGYIPVTYRAVLHKTGNTWGLIGEPYPLLTIFNTPDVDTVILDAANQLDAPSTVPPDTSGDGH